MHETVWATRLSEMIFPDGSKNVRVGCRLTRMRSSVPAKSFHRSIMRNEIESLWRSCTSL